MEVATLKHILCFTTRPMISLLLLTVAVDTVEVCQRLIHNKNVHFC